jgi:hypothetical protein
MSSPFGRFACVEIGGGCRAVGCFLVVETRVRDLLLRVKHLFVGAMVPPFLGAKDRRRSVAFGLRERRHTCLASRISMAATYGSLRQRLALRSASARLPAYSAWLQAAMPLGQSLLDGCAAKWITRQCE